MALRKRIPVMERIARKGIVEDRGYSTPCRIFDGCLTTEGYGRIYLDGVSRTGRVHRIVYEHYYGPIPEGFEPDHLCRQRDCCEITHLEAVPHRENVMRSPIAGAAVNARKEFCKRNHELAGENLHIVRRANGKQERRCRSCSRDRMREYRKTS